MSNSSFNPPGGSHSFTVEPLEPRLLLSADGAVVFQAIEGFGDLGALPEVVEEIDESETIDDSVDLFEEIEGEALVVEDDADVVGIDSEIIEPETVGEDDTSQGAVESGTLESVDTLTDGSNFLNG
jgi:hypothetical protein